MEIAQENPVVQKKASECIRVKFTDIVELNVELRKLDSYEEMLKRVDKISFTYHARSLRDIFRYKLPSIHTIAMLSVILLVLFGPVYIAVSFFSNSLDHFIFRSNLPDSDLFFLAVFVLIVVAIYATVFIRDSERVRIKGGVVKKYVLSYMRNRFRVEDVAWVDSGWFRDRICLENGRIIKLPISKSIEQTAFLELLHTPGKQKTKERAGENIEFNNRTRSSLSKAATIRRIVSIALWTVFALPLCLHLYYLIKDILTPKYYWYYDDPVTQGDILAAMLFAFLIILIITIYILKITRFIFRYSKEIFFDRHGIYRGEDFIPYENCHVRHYRGGAKIDRASFGYLEIITVDRTIILNKDHENYFKLVLMLEVWAKDRFKVYYLKNAPFLKRHGIHF